MWEKFGTSGRGMGVGSSAGVDVNASSEVAAGLDVGRGCNVTRKGEGVDSVKVGWQAGARKEAKTVIHNMRVINFMLDSFLTDYKSKIQVH
jgi:hypothetical protein